MVFFVIVLLLIVFSSAKAEKHNEFNRDYISKAQQITLREYLLYLFCSATEKVISILAEFMTLRTRRCRITLTKWLLRCFCSIPATE